MIFVHFHPLTTDELNSIGYGAEPGPILEKAATRLFNQDMFPYPANEADRRKIDELFDLLPGAPHKDMSVQYLAHVYAQHSSESYQRVRGIHPQLVNTMALAVASCVLNNCDFIRVTFD